MLATPLTLIQMPGPSIPLVAATGTNEGFAELLARADQGLGLETVGPEPPPPNLAPPEAIAPTPAPPVPTPPAPTAPVTVEPLAPPCEPCFSAAYTEPETETDGGDTERDEPHLTAPNPDKVVMAPIPEAAVAPLTRQETTAATPLTAQPPVTHIPDSRPEPDRARVSTEPHPPARRQPASGLVTKPREDKHVSAFVRPDVTAPERSITDGDPTEAMPTPPDLTPSRRGVEMPAPEPMSKPAVTPEAARPETTLREITAPIIGAQPLGTDSAQPGTTPPAAPTVTPAEPLTPIRALAEPAAEQPREPSVSTGSDRVIVPPNLVTEPARRILPVLLRANPIPEGGARLTIRLEPESLGQVDIRIDRVDDGSARVLILVERAETLTVLRQDQATLHNALDRAGLRVEAADFRLELAEPRPQAATTAQDGHEQPRQAPQPPRPVSLARHAADDESSLPPAPTWRRAGLDITA